jgi:hypothetical protein
MVLGGDDVRSRVCSEVATAVGHGERDEERSRVQKDVETVVEHAVGGWSAHAGENRRACRITVGRRALTPVR